MTILLFLLLGLVAGAIARLLVPGKDDIGFLGTILLGCVGSFVGGFLGNLIFGSGIDISAAGLIGSVIGAVIALIAYNAITGRKKVSS